MITLQKTKNFVTQWKYMFIIVLSLQFLDVVTTYVWIEMYNGIELNPMAHKIILMFGYDGLMMITSVFVLLAIFICMYAYRVEDYIGYYSISLTLLLFIFPVANNTYLILSSI